MPDAAIWTIGHSNHPLATFLDLLTRRRMDVLVDVRSSPYSRYASQFNRETIRPALQGRRIEYLYLGDLLGGRAEDPRFYDDQGRVLYGALAEPIDAARASFRESFFGPCPSMVDYLHLELLRTLAHDEPELLGETYPGVMV